MGVPCVNGAVKITPNIRIFAVNPVINTITETKAANCFPVLQLHWRSAETSAINGLREGDNDKALRLYNMRIYNSRN